MKNKKGYFPLIYIDNQYIMIFRCFTFFSLLFLSTCIHSQEIDSIIWVKKSVFIEQLSRKKGTFILNWAPPNTLAFTQSKKLQTRGQQLIQCNRGLLLHFAGGGLLYKMKASKETDSLWAFERLDETENDNYNFAALSFVSGNEIYNMGGYGFWKSNGTLRKNNWRDKEWDVAPISEELFIPGFQEINWHDNDKQLLYIPYQQQINTGLIKLEMQNKVSKTSYCLNLKTFQWEYLGQTSEQIMNLFKNSNFHVTTDHGILSGTGNEVYLVDYDNNKVAIYNNSSFAQSLLRMGSKYLRYYDKGKLYFFNPIDNYTDSISINRKDFKEASYPIWSNNNITNWLVGGFLLVIILGGGIYWYLKRKLTKPYLSQIKTTQPSKIHFSETESSLIKLLLDRGRKGLTATIDEINYVLGTKDKNTGMQKKVRSDVINSINEKYNYLKDESIFLIQSVRSETDKRYFEYLIQQEEASSISELITT